MEPHPRYEIVAKLAAGSFATVYRARDRELDREVAIKQIHHHYLDDPRQLERYWQEAQLLASLQHPNIVTIFDIVRERGWLIMELMQGNLADLSAGDPMDLNALRTTIAHTLRALKFLHERGLIHGDVKPGNLMVDHRRRVKLGDFGLVRRVTNEAGSLIKGTTKFMAPEVVSDDFGEVGPASDLYSLGFSAFKLMCGPDFESLFPGLSAFGRDKQMAWMMWHATADRKLPPISRVLDGVPEDLAHVIEKLTAKEQSQRYHSADEALADLKIDVRAPGVSPNLNAEAEQAEQRQRRRKRRLAIGALALSCLVSLVILLLPAGTAHRQAHNVGQAKQGIVRGLILDEEKIIVEDVETGIPEEVSLGRKPLIKLNDEKYILARELQAGDVVNIHTIRDEEGQPRVEIFVTRADESHGRIITLQTDEGHFVVALDGDGVRGELHLQAPFDAKISLNGKQTTLTNLQPGDRVVVKHLPNPHGANARHVSVLEALRSIRLTGFVRDVDVNQGLLTLSAGTAESSRRTVLPLAKPCKVTLNGMSLLSGADIKPADIKPGDRVSVMHDTHVHEIHATRRERFSGAVDEIRLDSSTLVASSPDRATQTMYLVGEQCEIRLNRKEATFEDLRRTDQVEITFDVDLKHGPQARTIDAIRPVKPNRWAIIMGMQNYDDKILSGPSYAATDARLLQRTLIHSYSYAPEQILLLIDKTRVHLEQSIPPWLNKISLDAEVLVYFSGQAYLADEQSPILAAKDFTYSRMAESGLNLSWLIAQLESCTAQEKVLLLDCRHRGDGDGLQHQADPTKMFAALTPPKRKSPFRSMVAIVTCGTAQQALSGNEDKHSVFAHFLCEAYAGKGDANRDLHLEPTELFSFLKANMAKVSLAGNGRDKPVLIVPDTSPLVIRLSAAAKKAIRDLLTDNWTSSRLGPAVAAKFESAVALANDQPEPRLAYGLLLLKTRRRDEARSQFVRVLLDKPHLLLPHKAIAWAHFEDRNFAAGIGQLTDLVLSLPRQSDAALVLDGSSRETLTWAGKLREFAVVAAVPKRRLDPSEVQALDAAVQQIGREAEAVYRQGRKHVEQIAKQFDLQLAKARDAKRLKLQVERRQLSRYARMDYGAERQSILAGMQH